LTLSTPWMQADL